MAKRITACFLALLLLTLSLAGCGKNKNPETTDDPASPNPEQYFDEVVMTIGDIEITYETYRYFYMSCRGTYEEQGTAKTVDEIKAEVLTELFYESAVHTLVNRYGTGLTDAQKKAIDKEFDELTETYIEYGYDLTQTLESRYMTEKVYKDIYAFETYLTENAFNYYKDAENGVLDYSDEKVSEMMQDYNRALLIYVGVGDEYRTDANAQKKVEGIFEKLADGTDFTEAAKEYSDAFDSTEPEIGFYFQKGGLIQEIEDVFFALEEGEYSPEAVKTDDGYYIVYRSAPDIEYFGENLYPYYSFNNLLQETQENFTVTYTDFFTTMFDGKDLLPETQIS